MLGRSQNCLMFMHVFAIVCRTERGPEICEGKNLVSGIIKLEWNIISSIFGIEF